jgi:hypothetical protein
LLLGVAAGQASEQYYAHYFRDNDTDGYVGGAPSLTTTPVFERPYDYDDYNKYVHPGVPDGLGNGVDDDCDGVVDGVYTGGLAFAAISNQTVVIGETFNMPLSISGIDNPKAICLQALPSGAGLIGQSVQWTPESADTNRTFLFTISATGGNDVIQRQFSVTVLSRPLLNIFRAVEITWFAHTNKQYQVQWTSSMLSNNWTNLGSPIVGMGAETSVFDRVTDDSRFYQVEMLP